MAKDVSFSTVKHGMNKSDHLDFLKNHEYTHAKNANLYNLQEGGLMLQSEASNLLNVDFGDFKVIGVRNIYAINKTIYFLFNPKTEVSKISLVSNKEIEGINVDKIVDLGDCDTESELPLPLEDMVQIPDREEEIFIEDECNKCLGFSLENPIKHIVIKEEATGISAYFTDNNSEQRVIHLSKKDWYTDNTKTICGETEDVITTNCLDCRKLRLHPQYSPIVAKAKSIQGSGNLKRGTYQAFIAYVNSEGLEISEYQQATQPVPIFDAQNSTLTQEEMIEEPTSSAIKIEIEQIDETQKYYKVIIVKRNNEGFKYYEEGIFHTRNKEIILVRDDDKTLVDKSILFLTIPIIKKAEILADSNGMLLQANVETQPEWNLQPVVNFMGSLSNWVTVEATEKFYADGINSANSKTSIRDETYAKSIRFLTNTGYVTPKYPLIGRPIYEDENLEKDKGSIEYKSIQQGNVTCDLAGREKVWQYENTAENLGIVDGYEGSGVIAPRKLEYFCQLVNIQAADEGAVRIILEDYDNQTFLGLASFINANRNYLLEYQGDDPGILELKAMLDYDENHCLPLELLETCDEIDLSNLTLQIAKITRVENEKVKFIETPFSLRYAKSDPPKYSKLFFVDSEGNEVEDVSFRDTFLHHGVPYRNWYRKSFLDHWMLPKREIHTNNNTCVNSDTLPFYETSVRGEDQTYLIDYNVETGIEEDTTTNLGVAKAKIGVDEVTFLISKIERVGDNTEMVFRDNVHNITIRTEGNLLGEQDLATSGTNPNIAQYYIDEDRPYTTSADLGGLGKANILTTDEINGTATGTFSFTANRYKRDSFGNIERDANGDPIIEEVKVVNGEFTDIVYREVEVGMEGANEYLAGLDPLLDFGRTYSKTIPITPGFVNYGLKRQGSPPNKPYGNTRFYRQFHDKSLWFKVDIPEEEDVILELTRTNDKTCGMRNKNDDFVGAVSLNMFRVSFWETCDSETPFFTTIINRPRDSSGTLVYEDIDPEEQRNEGLMKRIVTSQKRANFLLEEGMSQRELSEYDMSTYVPDGSTERENLLEGKSNFYVTVEPPVFATIGESKPSKYMLAPSCQSFSIVTRAIEYGIVDVSYDGILGEKIESYMTNCLIELPDPEDCNPQNFEYGEFSYTESNKTYPDNQELYNSKTLEIKPLDIKDPKDRNRFEGLFTTGVNNSGRYDLGNEANFSCKNIRHFKYPDNEFAPFLFRYALAEFSDATIYPLAFTINENTISNFLDIAVINKLITKEERDTIVGYEIFTGSREGNKSIQAKGILFDSYKYQVREKTVQFPNFPYNDLGDNTLFLDENGEAIKHPEDGDSNSNFMFMSPDIYNKSGVWASEMSVDSYQYGNSTTTFPEVKGHPKWIILGKKAYSTASKLATVETTVDLTLQLLQGIEAFRVNVGSSSGFNIPGIILHVAATALVLTQNIFIKRGSYKLQWMNTIRDLGTPYNFAHRSSGIGKYNYLSVNPGKYTSQGPGGEIIVTDSDNKLRGLTSREMLGEGLNTITDKIGRIHYVNNVDREKSMHLTLGMDQEDDINGLQESYNLIYTGQYSSYDNRNRRFGKSSRFTLGEVDRKGGPDVETIRNIASPYATLKNYMPEQYGEIGSIKWLTTSYYGDLTRKKERPTIFTGGSFISRFSEIRKIPLYLVDAMDQASLTTFEYNKNNNIGDSTKFYVDYEVSGEEKLKSLTMPEIRSNYNLDTIDNEEGFYLKPPSKFYLQYYGIVNYMVESDINANFRYAKEGIENSFYPQEADYVRLTEQATRPIRTPNTLYYDRTYSGDPIRMATKTLLSDYNREVEDILAKGAGLIIQSEVDNNEFSSTDPWTMYKPMNMYRAPTSAGRLVGLDGVESAQVLARFERGFSVINAVDTIQRMTNKDNVYGKGGIFSTRPMEFHSTDGGYAGSQNYNLSKTEFGHVWPNAEAGQIFLAVIGGNGMPNLQEISSRYQEEDVKMGMWFKNHLPFKVLKSGLAVDIDNPYNGVGIAMEYDSGYKRLLLTKRDYIVKNKTLEYRDKKFRETEGDRVDAIISQYTNEGWTYEGIIDSQMKFSKEEEESVEDCIESLVFIIAYRENEGPIGHKYTSPCSGGHTCNRAIFNVTVNNFQIGQVSLNNAGGPSDLINRFPEYGIPGYPYEHDRDRYNEITVDSQTAALILAYSDPIGSMTIKFDCDCSGNPNCATEECHENVSWMKVMKGDEELYSGCPTGNVLTDFIPCETETIIETKEEFVDLPIVEINDKDFKDVSWTISFYFEYGRWGSFYDFKPNFYVPQKNYIQSGINTDDSNSLWSHHLTKRSFQVFYGKSYDWEIEFPLESKGNNRYLEDVEYRLDAIRYQDEYDYYQNEEISFDEAIIYNNTTSSGKLELINRQTIAQQRNYPKRTGETSQQILQSNTEGTWSFNYFYNRVKDLKNRLPLFRFDENQIDREINKEAVSMYGKRYLDRLRGQNFLVNLKSKETQHQKSIKLVKAKENLYR